MTITAAYRAYVEDRQVYVAAGTLKTYAGHLKLFFDFLEERYRKDVQICRIIYTVLTYCIYGKRG